MKLLALCEGAGYADAGYAADRDGSHYILTGCRITPDGGRVHYRHKIRLNRQQVDAVGEIDPTADPIAGATPVQERIICALAEVLEPSASDDRTAGAFSAMPEESRCPRCGDRPIEQGDTICAACREELGEPTIERADLRPYTNTICPICRQAMRPAVHCPAAMECICMVHCFEGCEHLEDSISLIHCAYHDRKQQQKTV